MSFQEPVVESTLHHPTILLQVFSLRNGEVVVKKGRHKDDVVTDAKQLIMVTGNLRTLLYTGDRGSNRNKGPTNKTASHSLLA